MKDQFDIWEYNFPAKGLHPALALAGAKENIHVLGPGTTVRMGNQHHPYEVMLDSADGLSWETFCDCSIMWTVESGLLASERGHVALERRLAIRLKLRDLFRLSATD